MVDQEFNLQSFPGSLLIPDPHGERHGTYSVYGQIDLSVLPYRKLVSSSCNILITELIGSLLNPETYSLLRFLLSEEFIVGILSENVHL